jgi:hypothetical protein
MSSVENLSFVVERIFNEKKPKIGIEAAHIYSDMTPKEEHFVGARIAANYSNILESVGCITEKLLFVDNYNPKVEGKEQKLDLFQYIRDLTGIGYKPEHIVFEEDMTTFADAILYKLERENKVYKENGLYHLARGGIDLKDGKYHCSLLDAAFTMQKLNAYDIAITVLPQTRENIDQQSNMHRIIKECGYDCNRIINLWHRRNNHGLLVEFRRGNPQFLNGGEHDQIKGLLGLIGAVNDYMRYVPIKVELP